MLIVISLPSLYKDWILDQRNRCPITDNTTDKWRSVVQAIEDALPVYESTSEWISLGLAGPLRRRAIVFLRSHRKEWVLDSGAGPGVSSRMLLQEAFENVVGLDPSPALLRFAKSHLGDEFHPVLGVSEHLPFRPRSLGAVLTCFALRDAIDYDQSVEQFAQTTRRGGALAIVDIGKPENGFSRSWIGVYISHIMPYLARFWVRGRASGNPFKMIIPTWQKLRSNARVEALIERFFGPCVVKSFFLGGLVVFEADRFSVPRDILG